MCFCQLFFQINKLLNDCHVLQHVPCFLYGQLNCYIICSPSTFTHSVVIIITSSLNVYSHGEHEYH